MPVRSRILNALFDLLYGPLESFHEPAGRFVFGPSWAGRRVAIAETVRRDALLVDVGCGSGIVLSMLGSGPGMNVGLDLSSAMVRRAAKRTRNVAQADARRLPLGDATAGAVICTYPGPWILDPDVWNEFARITTPGAAVTILLGGTVTSGRFSSWRTVLIGIMYGKNTVPTGGPIEALGHDLIPGALQSDSDQWGTAFIWSGVKITGSGDV